MSSPLDVLFRETALCRFPDPEERDTLQRFGSMVLSWAVGAEHSEEGKATQTGSSLAAVAADLRHLSEYLRTVVDEVEGNVVEPAEAHLGFLAKRWAPKLAALAREVGAAVDAAEAEPAPERTARLRAALVDAQRLEALFEELVEAGGPDAEIYRNQYRRASDLALELETLLDEDPEEVPARAGRDLTAEESWRRADRCSWIMQALREARGVEAALQAIPEDGPDPELHSHLLVRASDLCTELELLLKNEGCPAREGEP